MHRDTIGKLPAIWEKLEVQTFEKLDSTNDWAKQHITENLEDEILILSKKQTNGRGRSGRSFYSEIDHGLYFSLAIHPGEVEMADLPLYTIAAATALMQAVEIELGLDLQVKWVNDLFYKNRKVSGILTEAITNPATNKIASLVIGIGLNLAGSFRDADSSTQEIAGTLYEELPVDFDEHRLLRQFLIEFGNYHENLETKEFLPIYERKLLGINQEVSYQRKKELCHGVLIGINEQGQLVVKNRQGELLTLFGGEIHFSSKQFKQGIGE